MDQNTPFEGIVETDLVETEARVLAHMYALLTEWQEAVAAAAEARKVIAKEMELRKKAFTTFFPVAKEGTNTFDLPEGWKLKGNYKLDRKVDQETLEPTLQELREMGVRTDTLIRYKPEVSIKEMKMLTAEARAIFNNTITTKEASPELTLVPPKSK